MEKKDWRRQLRSTVRQSHSLSWAALSIGFQGGLPAAEGGHPLVFVAPGVRRVAPGVRPKVADTLRRRVHLPASGARA